MRTTPSGSDIAHRRLDAARLAGSAALAVLGQLTVNAPLGYFGPADRMTALGLAFLGAVAGLSAAGVALRLLGRRVFLLPAMLQIGLVLAAFLPPLASDPVVAGVEVLWHLMLFGRLVFDTPRDVRRAVRGRLHDPDPARGKEDRNGPAVRHLLIVSLVISMAVLGFRLGDRIPAQSLCLALGVAGIGFAAPILLARLRFRHPGMLLLAALLVAALANLGRPTLGLSLLAAGQTVAMFLVTAGTETFSDLLDLFYRRPAYLILTSFLVLIAVGTLFLSFPVASAGPEAVAPLDAMFTATSASCVTGLIVLDTPNDFSTFGHIVILALIQMGGLNIMVLSAFAALMLGRGLGLRGEGVLHDILDVQPGQSGRRLVVIIVLGTLAAEALGALALGLGYLRHAYGPASAAWYGVFHAISAFCNAGFSLHSDSLVGFNHDPWMLGVVAALVTAGGLGFGVLAYVLLRVLAGGRRSAVLQARVVLLASGLLIVVGALVYGLGEWNRSLAGLPALDRVANAVFQSVTLRTAGFSSVPFDHLAPSTTLMMMIWMLIGASPGGTGGGIKTTTAVVLLGTVAAVLGQRRRIVLWGQRMPLDTVYKSAAIATVAALVVLGGGFTLLATQRQAFAPLLFETLSAFGTVGLSLDVTSHLDALGKLVVAVLMLVGRVGPLTLALLVGRGGSGRVDYPEARIMVG